MVMVKLLLLLIMAIAQAYTLTPPSAPHSAEDLREQDDFENRIPSVIMSFRIALWAWIALEGLVLFTLSGFCPSTLSLPLLRALLGPSISNDPTTAAYVFTVLKTPNPAFVSGTILIVAGVLLRAHTFSVLGSSFTFELGIRGATHGHPSASDSTHPNTHLLVTHGVYSIVRHPSYTGAFLTGIGWCLCLFDRQGPTVILASAALAWCQRWHNVYVYVPQWLDDATVTTAVLACMWVMALAMVRAILVARMDREDAMLEKHFGEEWRTWAKRVPWRLVPGVY